ncbi:hypothetical protein Dip510_000237 [Elusimicrobium posterum]|uniref:metallophosphoesterase family protein n=1 Tax=Elusimicrobium posterum TaxID=3116653 RepID=UPI003C73F0CE
MRKILFLIYLLLPLFSYGAEIVRGPYVEDPTLNSAVIQLQTNEASPAWLEYGPAPKCNQIMAVSPKNTNHKFVVYGLVGNKEFCYKAYVMNNNNDGVQPPVEGSFRTLYSPERKEVKFVIFGNTAGKQSKELLASKVEQHKADFYVHTGDLVDSGLNSEANEEFFTPFQSLFAKAPMFIAVGEKEYGADRAEKENRTFFRTNYARYHNMTWSKGTPNYYYFDTANARFFFLDTSFADGAISAPAISKDSAQYNWLKTSLATTGYGRWKIIVMHHPAYSTGESGSNIAVREAFSGLFEYYGVDVVLQGHDYNYERTFRVKGGEESARGVTYMTFGTGGAQKLTKREFKDNWTARFLSAQVYGVAEIVDRKLTIKIYNLEDKLIETVEIYM